MSKLWRRRSPTSTTTEARGELARRGAEGVERNFSPRVAAAKLDRLIREAVTRRS